MSSDPRHRNNSGMMIYREPTDGEYSGRSNYSEEKQKRPSFSWQTYAASVVTATLIGWGVSHLGDKEVEKRSNEALTSYNDTTVNPIVANHDSLKSDVFDLRQQRIRDSAYLAELNESTSRNLNREINDLESSLAQTNENVAVQQKGLDSLGRVVDSNYQVLNKFITFNKADIARVEQQGKTYSDALRLQIAERTGLVDSVSNEIYSSIALTINNWVGEHNDSVVVRRGLTSVLGHDGFDLPKINYREVADYIKNDSVLSQEVRRMASASILGVKDISDEEISQLASFVAVTGYNSDSVNKIAAKLFPDHLSSHKRYGVSPKAKTHEQYIKQSLLNKVDSARTRR